MDAATLSPPPQMVSVQVQVQVQVQMKARHMRTTQELGQALVWICRQQRAVASASMRTVCSRNPALCLLLLGCVERRAGL